jgi:hypothetical protein
MWVTHLFIPVPNGYLKTHYLARHESEIINNYVGVKEINMERSQPEVSQCDVI